MKTLLAIILVLSLTACSHECVDSRGFSSWEFQQSWFTSRSPGIESLGAVFGDTSGSFYEPFQISQFDYCAVGNRLYIKHGKLIKRRLVVEVLELDSERMLLRFQDGGTFEYFRAGR
jgi:hypothetical protein